MLISLSTHTLPHTLTFNLQTHVNAWTQAGSSNDNVYLCVPLCCLTSVYIHMFMWCQGSGHFTLVCAVVSQMRGTDVCHNYNYACWKDLTEGEVCLVPLMALKLCALPSFKQTCHANNDCFQTLFKHTFQTLFGCLDSANVHTQLGHSNKLRLLRCNEVHSVHAVSAI